MRYQFVLRDTFVGSGTGYQRQIKIFCETFVFRTKKDRAL